MHEEEQKIYRDRQMQRYQLLKEIYDVYFQSSGKGKQVEADRLNSAETLSYKYLEDLGMIEAKPIINWDGSFNEYTITARGINLIEEGRGRRRGDFRESSERPF